MSTSEAANTSSIGQEERGEEREEEGVWQAARRRHHCARCAVRVDGISPPLRARVAFYAGLVTLVAGACFVPFLGLAFPVTAPTMAVFGMAMGPLATAAFAPTLCPRCGAAVEPGPSA